MEHEDSEVEVSLDCLSALRDGRFQNEGSVGSECGSLPGAGLGDIYRLLAVIQDDVLGVLRAFPFQDRLRAVGNLRAGGGEIADEEACRKFGNLKRSAGRVEVDAIQAADFRYGELAVAHLRVDDDLRDIEEDAVGRDL